MHSLWSSPLTCYPALKGYKSIQLIHDYYPICPTSLCVVTGENDRICTGGYKKEFCLKKCTENGSKLQLFIKYIYMKLYEFIRKRYIDLFISPSQTLCNYLEEYKYNTICINNPLANIEKLSEEIKLKNSIKKYIYAGGINHQKGIIEFLNVFVRFSKNKDVCMEVYGDITDNNIKNDFYKLINQENSKIKYYGHVDNNIIRNALKQSDYMIMPSKWMENYPTSVLEAMASGTVVIGSNRGGIPEMLSNNCGLIYEYGNDEDLLDILTKSLHLKDIEYRKIRDNAYNKVNEYNTYEVYYDKIKKILKTNIL